ncbi:Fic family protein [Patescibacteria group bacterium]|nr:Fic family protein [Patescibacteria group bacterium]MBU2219521.1 Fic family protein [Patescibacteria group bacterium]
MAITNPIKKRIQALKSEYDTLRKGKESLLVILDEAAVPESVYNSNAIENSTLTLKETEKILLDMEVSRDVSLREVYEAKNLAQVFSYIRNKSQETEINKEVILLLHQMLIGGISDNIAGRFRKVGEYVRVGTHVAPAPEQVERMIEGILVEYTSNLSVYFLDKIAKFHLDFEITHPFCDGNGRIGRVLSCFQLQRLGFPMIIIRNREKKDYYKSFGDYRDSKNTKTMEKVLALALTESLHKRIAYLKGEKIITLADYTKKHGKSASALLNAARRQNISAFREKGVWKISEKFKLEIGK